MIRRGQPENRKSIDWRRRFALRQIDTQAHQARVRRFGTVTLHANVAGKDAHLRSPPRTNRSSLASASQYRQTALASAAACLALNVVISPTMPLAKKDPAQNDGRRDGRKQRHEDRQHSKK
jgi:hypothetical protein